MQRKNERCVHNFGQHTLCKNLSVVNNISLTVYLTTFSVAQTTQCQLARYYYMGLKEMKSSDGGFSYYGN